MENCKKARLTTNGNKGKYCPCHIFLVLWDGTQEAGNLTQNCCGFKNVSLPSFSLVGSRRNLNHKQHIHTKILAAFCYREGQCQLQYPFPRRATNTVEELPYGGDVPDPTTKTALRAGHAHSPVLNHWFRPVTHKGRLGENKLYRREKKPLWKEFTQRIWVRFFIKNRYACEPFNFSSWGGQKFLPWLQPFLAWGDISQLPEYAVAV